MAGLGNKYLQIIDLLKRGELAGGVSHHVVEALHTLNPVMKDANVMSCNMGTKHKSVIRTGLPDVSWGALYKGMTQGKSTTMEVEDTTGFIEGLSTVDARLLELSKDPAKVRMSEALPFLESISQQVESAFFYSDVAINGKKFHGLGPRYSSLSNKNVIDGGGSGSDNMSIWFVTHGDQATSIITPETIPGGIQREDMGQQRVLDSDGNPYYAKEEKFTQHVGVCVKDWRYNARVANIDVSDLIAGSVELNPLMRKAYYKLEGRRSYNKDNGGEMVGSTDTVIYMNRTALEALDAESTNSGTSDNFVRLGKMEVQGMEIDTWRGIPIRDTDHLLNTESGVV